MQHNEVSTCVDPNASSRWPALLAIPVLQMKKVQRERKDFAQGNVASKQGMWAT